MCIEGVRGMLGNFRVKIEGIFLLKKSNLDSGRETLYE